MTSRVRLDLQAEWLYDVEGLSYPAPSQATTAQSRSLADLAGYSAVQLFVQRTSQVQPRLVFAAAALDVVVRICQRLAGMPLAIELAAASARTLSLDEIEQRIYLRLGALETSLRDVATRHRSLRAVFEHSWALLSKADGTLFSRLAIFRGGCTPAAAEQLTGATLPALEGLVDKSLLRRASSRGSQAAQDATAELRFMQLEPLREFALEQLEALGERDALQQAHADYYLTLADAAMARWDGPDVQMAITQLERELNNIRAALQWARDSGQSTVGLQLAGVLWRFWRSAGYTTEGRAWLEELLAVDSPATDGAATSARLLAMHAAAWLASDQHDYARATQLFEQTTALRRALGEGEGETHMLLNQALHERAVGQYRRATAILEDTLARHRAMSAGGLGRSLYELGFSLYMLALVLR
ncbi:hypothetical protein SD80_019630, partial [Scytonema tolypothrichoides VB-61278]